ncbi:MAG: hypothetical protein KDB22_12840 [Planctomycetales bacterium]|nr:hypothetical protein [Planctomycetales bacterium]
MQTENFSLETVLAFAGASHASFATVESIGDDGAVRVVLPDSQETAVASILNPASTNLTVGDDVLVLMLGGQSGVARPVILGQVGNRLAERSVDRMESLMRLEAASSDSAPSATHDVDVDGRKVTLTAREELVLRCGKGSIEIRKNGKILIRGTELVTHASGTNRIKGGSVAIN